MVHELVREMRIIADHIDLVGIGGMNHIINGDVFIKQATMSVIIFILLVEEETASALRVHIPKQNTETTFSQETGQVNRSSGFSNASLDVIYSDLFQNLKLFTKVQLKEGFNQILPPGRAFSYLW